MQQEEIRDNKCAVTNTTGKSACASTKTVTAIAMVFFWKLWESWSFAVSCLVLRELLWPKTVHVCVCVCRRRKFPILFRNSGFECKQMFSTIMRTMQNAWAFAWNKMMRVRNVCCRCRSVFEVTFWRSWLTFHVFFASLSTSTCWLKNLVSIQDDTVLVDIWGLKLLHCSNVSILLRSSWITFRNKC